MTPLARLIPLLLVCLVPLAASAARGDSEQPVSIEANKGSIDNQKNVHVFEGGVVLSQGSLAIRCEKLVVTQDGDGFKKGVASGGEGGRASIRQRREGRDDFVEGRASRIEYDARSRKAILVGKAEVKSGGDEVRGEYIEYETESALRDYENVPLKDDIHAYFRREVHPHVPEAWINLDATRIGYEISFNKYFYRHQPLRSLEEVSRDILKLEEESEGLIREILEM